MNLYTFLVFTRMTTSYFFDLFYIISLFDLRFATYKWLSKNYMQTFQENDSWSCPNFMKKVQSDLILKCSKQKAYRTRKHATQIIEGTYKEQYALLWDYGAELKRSNPGSTVEFETERGAEGQLLFKRMYVCFKGCKDGFLAGCRPLIGLDGCHIKGHHTGQLLTAIGVDANNGMYPIAYAVVESEGKSSWSWFLNYLREDVKLNNGLHWTFITDKQKGLKEALSGMWEEGAIPAEHRHCARHLKNNFTKVSTF